jgi:hypothetical protein
VADGLGVTLIVGVVVIVGVAKIAVGTGKVGVTSTSGWVISLVIVGVGVICTRALLLIHKTINPSR